MMRAQSARVLRNNRDYDSFDDYDQASTIFVKPIDGIASKPPSAQSSTGSTAAFGLLLLSRSFRLNFWVLRSRTGIGGIEISFVGPDGIFPSSHSLLCDDQAPG